MFVRYRLHWHLVMSSATDILAGNTSSGSRYLQKLGP